MTSARDTVDDGHGHGHDDTMNIQSNVEISRCKPLTELTIGEVGRLLESIEFDEYKAVFVKNKIDGECLMKCNTVEDVVNMGISMTVKASLILDKIRKWKASGVPTDYFLVNPSASQDDDRNAEVKSPIVSYIPLTILHMLFYNIVLHTCLYVFIH